MNIVPRNDWAGDIPPNGTPPRIALPAPRLWLHHGADGDSTIDTARAYARYHIRQRGWLDIGYSFVIADGQVLEGRGAGRSGAHTAGDNDESHGICIAGDYTSRPPSDADLDALIWLLRHGTSQGWWGTGQLTGGHRDAPGASTSCPGDALHRLIPDINRRATGDDMAELSEDAQRFWQETYERLKAEKGSPSSLAWVLRYIRGMRRVFSQPDS